jgi:hypothetical protein
MPSSSSRVVGWSGGLFADVFVGGVIYTLSALAIGFRLLVVGVRAGAEVVASPWLAFMLT